MSYPVRPITIEEKEALYDKYAPCPFHTAKADISGCCIKLYTLSDSTKDMWEDNFYSMSEAVRSHGRVICLDDPNRPLEALYEPATKTAFLFNFDYYGWIKSVALAIAGDILEDEHQIYSVHGAALDMDGKGVTLIAPSKTGKTTHSWGLLRSKDARLVTDDWYYVRLSERRPVAFGSEKNCYIDADIGTIWEEYRGLVERAKLDNRKRAVVNVRWVTGKGSVVPMTTIYDIVLLKRDRDDPRLVRELGPDEAWEHLAANDLCNPHQLVRDERKMRVRERFFRQFLAKSRVHLVNTTASPQETQAAIRQLLG
ncbi:MAG TPA: hypothetical protein PKO24_03815 [Methanomassiliicoccales archaeon]|jgi:hypothetical protein|nr:hypothetical protein [Euryarchaeota archaeon]HOE52743.1 hypothetical protein [Methanomassiliicoccales archaeon]HRR66567.1 hypothetical protein [Methanomassiliicoccales archaeon]